MSTLLYSLGRWSYRRPWRVLIAWLLLLGIAGGGVALFMKGTDNSFSIPGTESQAGLEQLGRTFPQVSGTSAQLIIVAPEGHTVEDASIKADISDTVERIGDLEGVLAVSDPFDETMHGLVSDDETAAIIRLQFDGQATDVPAATKTDLADISADLEKALLSGSQVAIGGDLYSTSVPAISLIEAVGVLIALFVLIVTFRSFAVAWFPLASALIGVGLAIALIYVSTAFASVSSTTPMLAIMLGLAVGIDYALFISARHQDQVRAGVDPEESAARATGTAGSAVVFAGITVLIALVGLAFANIPFLTTMGIAAAVAVAIAVLVAVTLTPAFLGMLKGRVVGWRRRARRPEAAEQEGEANPPVVERASEARPPVVERASEASETKRSAAPPRRRRFADRWVGLVTRHPIVTAVAIVAGLGLTALPATSLALALPNAGMQEESSEARQAYDLVSEHFGPGANGPIILTGTIVTSTDPLTLMQDIGDYVATLPGVESVALATPNETADTGIVQLIPETGPDDPATADLVRELRAQHDHILDTYGVDMKVTGFTAVQIDISDRLGGALLPFAIFVVGLSLVLLTIVFRSIWVPVLAAAGYLLSVGAVFGILSLVFIHGVGADLLHVTKVGPIISFMPIILMGVLFGLAMDYQVFLVSRMREDYVHRRRDDSRLTAGEQQTPRALAIGAVRSGFTSSARVVTAAAVIMFAVFAAFVPEGDTSLKPIALGLAAGIAIDAFLVRMTLVPAVMALLGDKAWWLPRWLERVLPHFDIEGEAVERELSLADWPEPGTTIPTPSPDGADAPPGASGRVGPAVVAEGLSLVADDRELYVDVALRVEPGESLVVTSADPRSARALLLTVAGRVEPTDGRLRVGGHLLPGRGAWVRAHVGVALLDAATDPADDVRRALSGRATTVVLDGLDAATPAERDQVAAVLRDAAASRRLTVVASAADAAVARAVLTEAGRRPASVLDVSPGRRRIAGATAPPTGPSPSSSEVIA